MGHLNGIMGKYLKGVGKMVWKMGLELGNHPMVLFIKALGFKINSMVKEYLSIKTAHIKENSKIF